MVEVKGFNATAWSFNMKNRFTREWRDKIDQGIEHLGGLEVVIGKPG